MAWTGTITEIIKSPDSITITVRFDKDKEEIFTKTYNLTDSNSLKNIKELLIKEVTRFGDLQIETQKANSLIGKPINLI